MAWIGLLRPSPQELERVAAEFSLHPLAVEDALAGHQRSKLERYGDNLFAVLRRRVTSTRPRTVEFGELHVFIGPSTSCGVHAEVPDLSRVRRRNGENPELLARAGGGSVRHPRRVVDQYDPVARGLQNDVGRDRG